MFGCGIIISDIGWRHNRRDGVPNHQPHDCLLNCLFRRISKRTSKLRVNGLCAGNSLVTGEFPAQMASNAEDVSIWWRHHEVTHLHICSRVDSLVPALLHDWHSVSGVTMRLMAKTLRRRQMTVVDSRNTGQLSVGLTVSSDWQQRNINGPRYCPFVRGIHRWPVDSPPFVRGIHRWPVDSPYKGTVRRKCFHSITS